MTPSNVATDSTIVTYFCKALYDRFKGPRVVWPNGRVIPDHYEVSGTVTFNGQPVPYGVVYFDPDLAQGTDGMQGFAEIQNGAFRTADKGITGGAYIARIRGFSDPSSPQPLFAEYQVPIDLPTESSTHTLEVPASAARNLPVGEFEVP